jgi:hypothetical protein
MEHPERQLHCLAMSPRRQTSFPVRRVSQARTVQMERVDRPDRQSTSSGHESDSQDMLQGLPPSGSVIRAMLGVDAKNWQFLGSATGATTTVGPIIWTGQFQQIILST